MPDPLILAVIIATFLLAGLVKGVIGLGLPTVVLGFLTAVTDLSTAMALLIVPSFVTNLWQALDGGHAREVLNRIWPFLVMACATIWLGALALTRVDFAYLTGLLGLLFVLYGGLSLAGFRLVIPAAQERWAGPLFGGVNGILTGMTGAYAIPGVFFLQGIGLARDRLVQAMGMLFCASTIVLAFALRENEFLTGQLALASIAAIAPTAVGMALGRRIRKGLPEARFKIVFFQGVLLLGLYIVISSVVSVP